MASATSTGYPPCPAMSAMGLEASKSTGRKRESTMRECKRVGERGVKVDVVSV